MNKKVVLGFVAVFVVVAILDTIVNTVLMASVYAQTADLWRPEGEIKIWLIVICWIFFAFFFTFIFSKGYEGKGILEGVRYGLYVTGMMAIPVAYMTYAMMPVSYGLAFQWWIYAAIENVVAGSVLALIFGKQAPAPAPAA
jgi:hypothetical protein